MGLISFLRSSRGMTLLEVMMAVAVFGIIITFTTQMTSTSNRISGDSYNHVRMMEAAQAEMERIKSSGTYTSGYHGVLYYPPGTTEQQFYVTHYKVTDPDYNMLQVVVGPVPATPGLLDPNGPDNFLLVSWIP